MGRRGAEAGRPRVAYLSYSTGIYDARTLRMARSAVAAGYAVTVYARWEPGLPAAEEREGFQLVRVPLDWRLAIPGLRGRVRRRLAAEVAGAPAAGGVDQGRPLGMDRPDEEPNAASAGGGPSPAEAGSARTGIARMVVLPIRLARRAARRVVRPILRWRRLVVMFPLRPLGWARALEEAVEPADIWHGMWAGSLPALGRLRARHGGRTIYDSRDVYMQSRDFFHLERPVRPVLAALERHWARQMDAVLAVNEPCADLIASQLGVPRPSVLLNTPARWTPPRVPPDRLREAAGIDPGTAVVLYQGQLIAHRGIEQAMDAILLVPDAVLVLLGYGAEERYRARAASPPYAGRVFVLPAVPPGELLDWTASADVMVVAIQPTSTNHEHATPQKLFEAMAAGVPVVASDLPGMASVVQGSGIGELCDPTSPASIAAAVSRILDRSPADRAALRSHVLDVAHTRYCWETQAQVLLDLYAGLASGAGQASGPAG